MNIFIYAFDMYLTNFIFTIFTIFYFGISNIFLQRKITSSDLISTINSLNLHITKNYFF